MHGVWVASLDVIGDRREVAELAVLEQGVVESSTFGVVSVAAITVIAENVARDHKGVKCHGNNAPGTTSGLL